MNDYFAAVIGNTLCLCILKWLFNVLFLNNKARQSMRYYKEVNCAFKVNSFRKLGKFIKSCLVEAIDTHG